MIDTINRIQNFAFITGGCTITEIILPDPEYQHLLEFLQQAVTAQTSCCIKQVVENSQDAGILCNGVRIFDRATYDAHQTNLKKNQNASIMLKHIKSLLEGKLP